MGRGKQRRKKGRKKWSDFDLLYFADNAHSILKKRPRSRSIFLANHPHNVLKTWPRPTFYFSLPSLQRFEEMALGQVNLRYKPSPQRFENTA